jgi:4-amino-4-deoxy-L-arabinose transferase-like glycosyltransferase
MRLLDKKWLWVLLLCFFSLLIRAICFTGLIASDDLGYYHFARLISRNLYTPALDHYAFRYGLTIPVAMVYRIFGTTEWTTELIPYLASSVSVVVLVVIGTRLFGFRVGMIAGLLLATFPLSIRYASILVPEPVAEMYLLIAIALYLCAQGQYSLVFAIASGVFLALAYLTKEWSLFVVPAVLIDAVAERRWRACFGVVAGAIAILVIEHGYYLASTGDLLFRSHALAQAARAPEALAESNNLVRRLFTHYPRMMLVPGRNIGLHSFFTLALAPVAFVSIRWRQLRLLTLWALLPFLYMNFGSMSLSHYIPVFSQPRYLEVIYPPVFVMAGAAIDRSAAWEWRSAWLVALSLVALIGCYCAVLTKGTGWRTADVTAIRGIVECARERHLMTIHFEGASDDLLDKWRDTAAILAPGIKSTDGRQYDVLVRPDALGIPSVVSTHHSE